MATKLHVIGNWKMHGSSQHVQTFFTALMEKVKEKPSWISEVEGVICPPFVYLPEAARHLNQLPQFKLGAQDISSYEQGAYTGQVSGNMLAELHCHYVVVGHSERRLYCHESNEEIANKFFAAKKAGLVPILCLGETKSQREQAQTEQVILAQLQSVLAVAGIEGFRQSMLAYEPVWAIGTGLTATPEQAQEIHHLLRRTLAEYDAEIAGRLPILYGGSVKSSNAYELFQMADIDGALVGGASLQASDFWAICEVAGRLTA